MSDSPPPSYPNEADALNARLRDRQSISSATVLVQVCLDVLGISRDPEIQKQGLLARMGAAEAEAVSMRLTYKRLERYGRVCATAGVVVMIWVALNVYITWRNELSSAPPAPAPYAARVP